MRHSLVDAAVGVAALRIRGHGDIHLEEPGWEGASGGCGAPPSDSGHLTCVQWRGGGRETDRGHLLGEGDRGAEGQDAEVIVQRVWPGVAGVVSDVGDGPDVSHRVCSVVLPKQHPDAGRVRVHDGSAVGRCQNMAVRNDGATTPGHFSRGAD